MATFLSSLDALQDQDPPPACRLRRRREKLGQGGHGLFHHLLYGHLFLFLSRELMFITLSFLGLEVQTLGHHSLLLRT